MVEINRTLLSVQSGYIIHQVNCQYKMGAGIAKDIRALYPRHYADYMASNLWLGNIVITNISDNFGVIGICAQDRYGRDRRYTDYDALEACLVKIAKMKEFKPAMDFYMPKGMGCRTAGGDWAVVKDKLEKITPFVILCKYN